MKKNKISLNTATDNFDIYWNVYQNELYRIKDNTYLEHYFNNNTFNFNDTNKDIIFLDSINFETIVKILKKEDKIIDILQNIIKNYLIIISCENKKYRDKSISRIKIFYGLQNDLRLIMLINKII